MRTPEEDEEVTRLMRDFDEAIADALDAQSRAASIAEELTTLGIDIWKLRPEASNV